LRTRFTVVGDPAVTVAVLTAVDVLPVFVT
jgi:hypothetical protein